MIKPLYLLEDLLVPLAGAIVIAAGMVVPVRVCVVIVIFQKV